MYVKCFVDAYFSDEFYNRVMGLYVYTRVHKQNKRQIRISKITEQVVLLWGDKICQFIIEGGSEKASTVVIDYKNAKWFEARNQLRNFEKLH